MYTQCPACSTYFRITPAQLDAAGGKVRCGECHSVFYAPDRLTETLPAAPPQDAVHDEPHADEPDYEELLREPAVEEPPPGEAAAVEPPPREALPPVEPEPAADDGDDLAIDLDELFGNEEDTAPLAMDSAAVSEIPAAPLPAADTYGEEDIEALLKHTPPATADQGEFELPWANAPGEAVPDTPLPADVDLASLDIDAAPDALNDFDLPDPQLTTAHSVAPMPAAPLPPLPAVLLEETEAPPRRGVLAGLLWTLGSLLLLSALALQYVYLNRAVLVYKAELRPLLELMCGYTACTLPPRRDLAALTLIERDIRSHDRVQGALTISATLQNRAPYAQPYPVVEVVMRDLGGKAVAARRFLPQEYLPDGTPAAPLASQATAQLVLDVVDPGADAVGFEFTFH
jgi:predicted Zn finger-like uncharacterized protein